MDENDEEALANVIRVCKALKVLGLQYNDASKMIYMIITIHKSSYKACLEELKKIPRIEVV